MSDTRHSLPPGLPGVLGEVAALTSPETAEIVARAWGGRRKYVPAQPGPDHELSRLIGHRDALVIGRAIGNGEVRWPSAVHWLRLIDARRLCDRGVSHAKIGRALGITEKRVHELLKGYGPPRRPGRRRKDEALADCDECRGARYVAERSGLSDRWLYQILTNARRVPGAPPLPPPEACPVCGTPFRDPPRPRPKRSRPAPSTSEAGDLLAWRTRSATQL